MRAVHIVVEELRVRDLLDLVQEIAARRGVRLDQLCGAARTRSVSFARQEAWWRMRHHPERCYSLPEIARLFGRHHTTVLTGVAAHEHRLAKSLFRTPPSS